MIVSDGVDAQTCEKLVQEKAQISPEDIANALYESAQGADDVSLMVLEIVNYVDIL